MLTCKKVVVQSQFDQLNQIAQFGGDASNQEIAKQMQILQRSQASQLGRNGSFQQIVIQSEIHQRSNGSKRGGNGTSKFVVVEMEGNDGGASKRRGQRATELIHGRAEIEEIFQVGKGGGNSSGQSVVSYGNSRYGSEITKFCGNTNMHNI